MNIKTVKRTLANVTFPAMWHTKSYLLTRPFFSGLGSILMFHRVCPEQPGPRIRGNSGLEVTPEYLEATIKYFMRNDYAFVSLDRIYEILNGKPSGKKFVAYTFDDGYVDNFTHAFPIFKRYNIPFSIYVTTNFPDREAVMWWYLLEDLVLEKESIEWTIEGHTRKFSCATEADREMTFHRLRTEFSKSDGSLAQNHLIRFFESHQIDPHLKSRELALNWEQIAEMSGHPLVTLGAHTVSHPALNKLTDRDVIQEIEQSREKIQTWTGRKVEHFSYPFGTRAEAGEREFAIVKSCGFKTATTTRPANIFPGHRYHKECLPRILINEKRDNREIQYLDLWTHGLLPCILNKCTRVVTA